jgi:hypothetical protein
MMPKYLALICLIALLPTLFCMAVVRVFEAWWEWVEAQL